MRAHEVQTLGFRSLNYREICSTSPDLRVLLGAGVVSDRIVHLDVFTGKTLM